MGRDLTRRRRGVELDLGSGGAVASLSSLLLFAEVVGEYLFRVAGLEVDAIDDAMARPPMSSWLMSRLKDSSSTLARCAPRRRSFKRSARVCRPVAILKTGKELRYSASTYGI